ncbi:cytochrome P450 [Dendrothele bispora CBS 962.96]|uniref:Cytochrome P450 n=1 Tax=Dendrothele bispora (strain CBS 962.96) TaxID=1314807 RepID=A0A4S8LSC6_DENBC|nr:cytochrome P450 [Dendrothele bispora CBS 962.96]
MNDSSISLNLILGALIILVFSFFIVKQRSSHPLPPGPPGIFSGRSITFLRSWQELENFTDNYGPVCSFRNGSKVIVVIGRLQACIEIMEQQGSSLIDRPKSVAAGEILSQGMRLLLMSNGKRFKQFRKVLHSRLNPAAVPEYEELQMRNARDLILDIFSQPEKHLDHARKFAVSFILSLTYGKKNPTSLTDPEVLDIQRTLQRMSIASQPGTFLVDHHPLLKYIPMFVKTLRIWHQEELSLYRRQLSTVAEATAKNDCQPCFGKFLLESKPAHGLNDDEMAYLAGSMFGAGSETTANSIGFIIMASACFPEAQAEVQRELDEVVGRDSLPTFKNRQFLPKLSAFVTEVLRWRAVSGTGFAHVASKDIFWNGYCIPKGATVIGNHWSICRDPDVFPEPEEFRIDRWLDKDGQFFEEQHTLIFGFGRRVCPGQHVANRSLFIATALLLWAFRITQDPQNPINTKPVSGAVGIKPSPFVACYQSRIPNLEAMLQSELE